MNTDECATEPQSHREKLKRIRSDFKSVYGKDWLTTGGTGNTGIKKRNDNPSFSLPRVPRAPVVDSGHAIEIRSRRNIFSSRFLCVCGACGGCGQKNQAGKLSHVARLSGL